MKSVFSLLNSFLKACSVIALVFILSSCAGVVNVQTQINAHAVGGRYDQALASLEDPSKYGENNRLLYLFDKGLILQMAGRYSDSAGVFEESKRTYDELYTRSISKNAESWLWNDYALPYRGEDFERVMVNILEAVDYAALGKIDEAIVEARDVNNVLNLINGQYDSSQKNVYRDDAFARLLMGILYEAGGKLNDAVISYKSSLKTYERDYLKSYGTPIPRLLKENLLAAAEKFGDRNIAEFRTAFAGIEYTSWDDKQNLGEIYFIEYQGLSPVKVSQQIPVPLPDGIVTQIAFPRYEERSRNFRPTVISATGFDGGVTYNENTELGEDIGAIAVKNLADRKIRVIAKSALRAGAKYVAERALEQRAEKNSGEGAAFLVKLAGSVYNIFSEQADLRCWQTLPGQIRIGRLLLKPGDYDLKAGNKNLEHLTLAAGEKRFFLFRTIP